MAVFMYRGTSVVNVVVKASFLHGTKSNAWRYNSVQDIGSLGMNAIMVFHYSTLGF